MKNRYFTLVLTLSAILVFAEDFGHFIGQPQTQWNDDGRTMKVLKDFTYVDAQVMNWTAPAGSTIDGASIPPVFWPIIGGPFEGQYRNASIVHDTECQPPHKHNWRQVHRMFYAASRAGGVGPVKAKIMFAAVYHFGPRWPPVDHAGLRPKAGLKRVSSRTIADPGDSDLEPATRMESEDDAIRLELFIKFFPDFDLPNIEQITSELLRHKISQSQVETERLRLKKFANSRLGDPDLEGK